MVFLATLIACKSNESVPHDDATPVTESPVEKEVSEDPTDVVDAPATVLHDTEESPVSAKSEGAKSRPKPPRTADVNMVMVDAYETRTHMASDRSPMRGSRPEPIGIHEDKDYSAGQITAAEWNDLFNWDAWKELLNNQDYNEMQTHWQIYPRSRYSVFVRNKYELPLQNIRIELLSRSGDLLWTARTDNAGRAELWSDIRSIEKSFEPVDARYTIDGKSHKISDLKTIELGVNHITVDVECRTGDQVDIVLAVDATGSMGDEIKYLQSELKDVIERSLVANQSLNVRMGSVFYRDRTDEYLTRVQPLSDGGQKTLEFIGAQSAGGGGDYPEAVDAALEEALSMDWSERAIARIIFFVLDAPPHHDPEVLSRLGSQIEEAARLGIKIIPITASGINRQTEFLMKFMAIATNGTYVFITDHSGIGNPHLDPVVQEYEVEKLNDLLVRLLYHYTKSNGCDANDPSITEGIKVYPNPASTFVQVSSDKEIKNIQVVSNSGKVMIRENVERDNQSISLDGLVDGVYMIRCFGPSGECLVTEPVVVVGNR